MHTDGTIVVHVFGDHDHRREQGYSHGCRVTGTCGGEARLVGDGRTDRHYCPIRRTRVIGKIIVIGKIGGCYDVM